MTDKQLEALRLADALDLDPMPVGWYIEAAAELRRLHEVNEELITAAMLALVAFKGHWNMDKTARDREAHDALVAALAKATGEQQ